MIYEIAGLVAFVAVLLAGIGSHVRNLIKIYKKFKDLCGNVNRSELFEKLSRPQGSNFTALVISAWMLVAAAFTYLFFFEPIQGMPISYFSIITLFSGPLETGMQGILVLIIAGMVIVGIARLRLWPYNFYAISSWWKKWIIVPIVLLFISTGISISLGLSYPDFQAVSWALSLVLLIASEAYLLLPVVSGVGRANS